MAVTTFGAPRRALSPCPLCRQSAAVLAGDKDRSGRPLTTLFCLGCGLLRIDPLPTAADLRAYYLERYRLEYKGVLRPRPHHVIRAAGAARDRLRWLLPHLPSTPARWLDVGAGSGEFAFLLHRLGSRVTALEPNRGYGDYLRDTLHLDHFPGFLEDLPATASASSFDGVSCFHMLEHHPDPIDALRRIAAQLRPDGLLALEVPNAAFAFTHPDSRFHPAHLVHFNAPNLEFAARAAGFEPLALHTSADGGILWGVFRKSPGAAPAPVPPETVESLRRAECRRSLLRYYTAPAVWLRTLRRLVALAAERLRALSFDSPESFLSRADLLP